VLCPRRRRKRYLFGRPFTWLYDCSGLKRFFDGDDPPTHVIQRWRAEILQFNFTFEHRPADMLTECDVLSRYNMATAAWRSPPPEAAAEAPLVPLDTSTSLTLPAQSRAQLFDTEALRDNLQPTSWYSLSLSLPRVVFHCGPSLARASKISNDASSQQRVLVVIGAATVPIDHALELLGAEGTVIRFDSDIPSSHLRLSDQTEFFDNVHDAPAGSRVIWFVAVYTDNGSPDHQLNSWVDKSFDQAERLIQSLQLSVAIIMCPFRFPRAARLLQLVNV
jgi:hypothetical protein